MRYVGKLITAIRSRVGAPDQDFSEDVSGVTTSGISPEEVLEVLNEAQNLAQAEIINLYPQEFMAQTDIDLTVGTSEYTIVDNVFINKRLDTVFYSHSGQERDFAPLDQRPLRDRIYDDVTHPPYYHSRGSTIIVPPPTGGSGKLRVDYYRQLDRLDIRRGKISSTTATTIVLANDGDLDTPELDNLIDGDYLCVVDKHGAVQDYSIEFTSYDSGTRTITIPNTTLTGGTDDYVVIGKYATTHSPLPNIAESFLRLYAQKRLLDYDSSMDAQAEDAELIRSLNSILKVYADPDEDIQFVPILDGDIMY